MTDEVSAQVLRNNYEQNVVLGNARAQEAVMLPVHQRLIHYLERHGDLDRTIEFLPSDAEIVSRQKDGMGLKSPEFSIVIAYTKLDLKRQLLPTTLPDDPWFRKTLVDYFPREIRERYADVLDRHPLKREIVTNAVVNSVVNRGGMSFAFRANEETGASAEQIARAFVVCHEVFGLTGFVRDVEALDNVVSTEIQTTLYLELRRLLDRSVRWFLSNRTATIDVAGEVARFEPLVTEFAPQVADVLQGAERRRLDRTAEQLVAAGAPQGLAKRAAVLLDVFSLLDVIEISGDTDTPPGDVLRVYYHASERFGIDEMLARVAQLPRDDRWDALARGALRDDLYTVLEQLTRAVLAHSDPGQDASARFAQWAAVNADTVARAKGGLRGIERLESANIAALSVALRTLRGVVKDAG